MRANPRVSNTVWIEISKEVGSALSKSMTEKGGMLYVVVRASVHPMSTSELKRLDTILNDPVYVKFEAGMSAPSTQRQMMQAAMVNAMRAGPIINRILVHHGLNEVH